MYTDISFINNGKPDATEFDTIKLCELAQIWLDFSKENNLPIYSHDPGLNFADCITNQVIVGIDYVGVFED